MCQNYPPSMSYIEKAYTIKQFLGHISKPQTSIAESALSSLDRFSMKTYQIPGERLGIVSATLIAAIFFHSSFPSAQIPPVSYLTLADKIMMSAYAMLRMCLLSDLIHKKNQDTLKEKYTNAQEKNLDEKFRIMTPLISVGVFLIVQFLF